MEGSLGRRKGGEKGPREIEERDDGVKKREGEREIGKKDERMKRSKRMRGRTGKEAKR